MGHEVRVLGAGEVRDALPMAACIDAVEAAFVAYSGGHAELPGVIHLDVPESRGEVHVKAGHLHGAPAYAVKVASGFAGPPGGRTDGLVLVFDSRDGSPVAIMLDGGVITETRTGAAGGVAARWLAPERVERVAVIGTGAQARRQVEALRVVRPGPIDIRVWGRHAARASACARDVGGSVAASIETAVTGSDVIITCTAAREPLVRAEWVEPGAHITAVGSDGVGKQELDQELLRRADVLVVDSLAQCERLGELQHAPEQTGRAVEIGRICAGLADGRTGPGQLSVADLTGVGVQDVAAANLVLSSAPLDAGTRLQRKVPT